MGDNLLKLPPVVILAGGKGTRSLQPTLPKILQKLDEGHTLLDHWVSLLTEQGFSDCILVLAHGADLVSLEVAKKSAEFKRLNLQVIREISPEGTYQATLTAMKGLGRALVVMGDSLSYINYKFHYLNWMKSKSDLGIFVHANSHAYDSDSVSFDEFNVATQITLKGKGGESTRYRERTLAMTGAFFLKEDVLVKAAAPSTKELVSHFETQFKNLSISVIPFLEASIDTGTPERLEKAVLLHARKKCAAQPTRFVVLDRDGTLVPDLPEGRKELSNTDISALSARAIRTLNDLQVPVFIVTNQPGVAKGWITEEDVDNTHAEINNFLQTHNAWIDDFAYCKHHPKAGFMGEVKNLKISCTCRKPNPGLVIALAEKYGLNVRDAIVIGDSSADAGLANNLGVPFYISRFDPATNKSDLGEVVKRLVGETCF